MYRDVSLTSIKRWSDSESEVIMPGPNVISYKQTMIRYGVEYQTEVQFAENSSAVEPAEPH